MVRRQPSRAAAWPATIAAVSLLRRPRLGLDRGDARGVQALLMPETRDEAAARSCGRGEPCGALLRRGGESVQLHRLLREPRVEGGEPLPRLACLLDDPVVLAGGAAEAVEPGERLVERLGAQQDGERVALVRPVRREPGRAPRAGTRRCERPACAIASCFAAAARSCATCARRAARAPARPVRGGARSRARTARASRRSRARRASRRRHAAGPSPSGRLRAGRRRRRQERSERPPAGRSPSRRPRGAPRPSLNASPRGRGP